MCLNQMSEFEREKKPRRITKSAIRYHLIKWIVPEYIPYSIKQRKGRCIKCGKCCKKCRNLFERNGKKLCSVYKDRVNLMVCFKHRLRCRLFPIDEKDKMLFNPKCGYYWSEE